MRKKVDLRQPSLIDQRSVSQSELSISIVLSGEWLVAKTMTVDDDRLYVLLRMRER